MVSTHVLTPTSIYNLKTIRIRVLVDADVYLAKYGRLFFTPTYADVMVINLYRNPSSIIISIHALSAFAMQ
jgi:hypothetical protein